MEVAMRLVCVNAILLGTWLCVAAGCVGAPDEERTGEISVNLVGTAPSGVIYRLRNTIVRVEGPSSAVFNTDADPNQTSLSANVVVGNYVAGVQVGQMERIDGQTVTPVDAMLISENPTSFTVAEHQRTTVPLRFLVQGSVVDMTQGYDIVVTVEEGNRYEASADAVVRSDNPNTNFGTQPWLFTYGSGPGFDVVMRSLIAFDLTTIPTGASIQGAFLNVRMVDQAGVDFSVEVHEVLEAWSETGVTWNNKPAVKSNIEASLDFQGYTWWRFDVTALIRRWVAAPGTNHGLLLKENPEVIQPNNGAFARFDSREATDRPYLELTVGN
jgi:TGF-beta propeptide